MPNRRVFWGPLLINKVLASVEQLFKETDICMTESSKTRWSPQILPQINLLGH